MKAYVIILYLFVLIAVGATADGLDNSGVQTWGHLLEALEVFMLFSFVFLFKIKSFLYALGAYICFRVAGFDYLYNLASGHIWSYVGGSNWWDMLLARQVPGALLFGRVIFLITGIAFVFNNLKKRGNI